MSGPIDIGWTAPPFGLKGLQEGKIRIVAHGGDVPSLHGQTVRALLDQPLTPAPRAEFFQIPPRRQAGH